MQKIQLPANEDILRGYHFNGLGYCVLARAFVETNYGDEDEPEDDTDEETSRFFLCRPGLEPQQVPNRGDLNLRRVNRNADPVFRIDTTLGPVLCYQGMILSLRDLSLIEDLGHTERPSQRRITYPSRRPISLEARQERQRLAEQLQARGLLDNPRRPFVIGPCYGYSDQKIAGNRYVLLTAACRASLYLLIGPTKTRETVRRRRNLDGNRVYIVRRPDAVMVMNLESEIAPRPSIYEDDDEDKDNSTEPTKEPKMTRPNIQHLVLAEDELTFMACTRHDAIVIDLEE